MLQIFLTRKAYKALAFLLPQTEPLIDQTFQDAPGKYNLLVLLNQTLPTLGTLRSTSPTSSDPWCLVLTP